MNYSIIPLILYSKQSLENDWTKARSSFEKWVLPWTVCSNKYLGVERSDLAFALLFVIESKQCLKSSPWDSQKHFGHLYWVS